MIKLNIQIINSNGDELLETQLHFESLDFLQLRDTLAYELAEQARTNALTDGTSLD